MIFNNLAKIFINLIIIFMIYVETQTSRSKAKRKLEILVTVLKLSGEISNILVKIQMIYFAQSSILIEIFKVKVIIKKLSFVLGNRNNSIKNTNISFEYLTFSLKSNFLYLKIILVIFSFFKFQF